MAVALPKTPAPRKRLLELAWPAILENVLYMIVWVVDTAMVGHVSSIALAAVGIGGQFVFASVWVFASLGIGATALVARAIGAGDLRTAEKSAAQALMLAGLCAVALAVIGYALAPLLIGLLAKDSLVYGGGLLYARVLFVASIFMLPLTVTSSILRGAGDTKTPMLIALVTNVCNIVLDYLLIFGKFGFPALGVLGAALASGISQAIGCSAMILILRSGNAKLNLRRRSLYRWDRAVARKLLKLSLPAGLEEAFMNIGRTFYIAMIAQLGTLAFAANQVAVAVESISFMPGYGFAVATTTVVGQHLGAGSVKEAKAAGYYGARLSAYIMGVMGVVFILLPHPIISLFTRDPEVVALGVLCLRIAGLVQLPVALEMSLAGAMRGAGETKLPMKVAVIGNFLVRLPLVYVVVNHIGGGLAAIWAITVLDWSVRAVLLFFYYRQGRWAKTAA